MASAAADATSPPRVPSASQRAAIEAPAKPVLVLAGPGAGKTFCLIERVRFLVDKLEIDPARICVFTFTNKAAGEIAERLESELGARVERVKRGTIHAFCTELLREFGEQVGLQLGFGIADDDDQLAVLRHLKVPQKLRKSVLEAFARYRFCNEPLGRRDRKVYDEYRDIMARRNMADFDTLVLKTAELFRIASVGAELRGRWDAVLVDEFQDLNRIQYAVIRQLASGHRHVFAVGDDEQSVYSWTGADPKIFRTFATDFEIDYDSVIHLDDNWRCPPAVLDLARRLIALNEPIFKDRAPQAAKHESSFPVSAFGFANDQAETNWIINDLRRDRAAHDGTLAWGDVALLYRRHKIGSELEAALLNAGIPCCLAKGRAMTDDKVVAYTLAALQVIAYPGDEIQQERFYQTVLPSALFDSARARADESGRGIVQQLEHMARTLPHEDGDRKKIWRGHYSLQNLSALGKRHTSLAALVEDILSEKVGTYRTVLEEHQEELSDPAEHEEVARLGERIERTITDGRSVWVPRVGGVEIPARRMLLEMGVRVVDLGGAPRPDAEPILPGHLPQLGLALGLFKTAQLVRTRTFANTFDDFTAVDIETTDKNIARAEIVEIAAVRVRHGRMVDEYRTFVKPRVPISAGALAQHKISESDVADAPYFEAVWPAFREFCGRDLLVAHNGYQFDFPILRRMSAKLPRGADFFTYDTLPLAYTLFRTSCKLPYLARHYGIPTGQSHRALDDTRALAQLIPALSATKVACARKTAMVHLLDQLGVALALSNHETLCGEAVKFLEFVPRYAFRRQSDCLDFYRSERDVCGDGSLPTVDRLITLLGGQQLMARFRTERSADKRYPETMGRLRSLIDTCCEGQLPAQICAFLEKVVLSKYDKSVDTAKTRVNLLTLHSTKGLEFSRVYIVGVEDELFMPLPPSGSLSKLEVEEARRLLYVGMTRTIDRLVMTRVKSRAERSTGGHRFLDEMGITPKA
ncbi:MAG TPA: UvrD-helicase domain-containing protein [Gemmatimonadaceae bacterium]